MEPQRQTRTDTQAEEALYGPPGVWLSRSRGSGDRALRPGNEAAGTAQASTAVNSQDTRDQRKHTQSSTSFLSFVHLLCRLLRTGVLKSPTLIVMCFSPVDRIDLSTMNFEFLLLAT